MAEDLAFLPSPVPEAEDSKRNEEQWQKQDVAAADDEHDDPDRKTDRKQSPHSTVSEAGEETAPTGLEQREHHAARAQGRRLRRDLFACEPLTDARGELAHE
jgi:hypothetical protein